MFLNYSLFGLIGMDWIKMGLKFFDWVKAVIQSRIAVYDVIYLTIVNIMINLTLLKRLVLRVTVL